MQFANPILSGTTLVRDAIHSEGYVAGVSGWSINRDGSAEFQDLLARGQIIGTELDIDNTNVGGFNRGRLRIFFDSGSLRQILQWFMGQKNVDDLLGSGVATETHPASIIATASTAFESPLLRITSGRFNNRTAAMVDIAGQSIVGASSPKLARMSLNSQTHFEAPTLRPVEAESTVSEAVAVTSFTHGAQGVFVPFTAPASGRVRIDCYYGLQIDWTSSLSRSLRGTWELRTGTTNGGGSIVSGYAASENNGVMLGNSSAAGHEYLIHASAHRPVEGLTPGSTYHVRTMHRVNATSGAVFTDRVRRLTVTPAP